MASIVRDFDRCYTISQRSKSLRCDMSLNKFLKQAISSFRHQDSSISCFLSKEQGKIFSLQPGEKTA
jgi:hypothetical protein